MPTEVQMEARKHIALVAHDHRKADLLAWAKDHRQRLVDHELFATGGTGKLLSKELDLPIESLLSGPLGGDQQIGSHIAEGKIDVLVFFWDPLEPQPHDPDVKALLRLAVLYDIPTASNRSTANFLMTSPLFASKYTRTIPDYAARIGRG